MSRRRITHEGFDYESQQHIEIESEGGRLTVRVWKLHSDRPERGAKVHPSFLNPFLPIDMRVPPPVDEETGDPS